MAFNGDYLTGDKMTDLTVANTLIRKNENGLYCLDDLYNASQYQSAKQPRYFLDTIAAIPYRSLHGCTDGVKLSIPYKEYLMVNDGESHGYWANMDVLLGYAEWLSYDFYEYFKKSYDLFLAKVRIEK